MSTPIYRDGWVHVRSSRCRTCVFNGSKPRAKIAEALWAKSVITCHESEQPATCRVFFEVYADQIPGLVYAEESELMKEVE